MMGYNTEFKGVLKFLEPLDIDQLKLLKSMEGIDPDDAPELIQDGSRLSYIQFEVTPDFSGIQYDGNEKFYEAVNACNFLINNMKAKFPQFGLEGQLEAQGEEFDDRWILAIENGKAVRRDVVIAGQKVECPHCGEKFVIDTPADGDE